jgi:hypothetical protein
MRYKMGKDPAAARGGFMLDPPSASAWQETLKPISVHIVEREKRLDKAEKVEEQKAN